MATTTTTTQVLLQLQLLQAVETRLLLQQLLHQVLFDESMIMHPQILCCACHDGWVPPNVHMQLCDWVQKRRAKSFATTIVVL